jgi:hypothetical protein
VVKIDTKINREQETLFHKVGCLDGWKKRKISDPDNQASKNLPRPSLISTLIGQLKIRAGNDDDDHNIDNSVMR